MTQTGLQTVLQALDREDNPFVSDSSHTAASDSVPPPALAKHSIHWGDDSSESSSETQVNQQYSRLDHQEESNESLPILITRDRDKHESDSDSD